MPISKVTAFYSAQSYNSVINDYKFIQKRINSNEQTKATLEIKKVDNPDFIFNTSRSIEDLSDYVFKTCLNKVRNERVNNIVKALPVVGRVAAGAEKIKEKDTVAGLGTLSLALLYGPEDVREIYSAYEQIKAISQGNKYKGYYDYKVAQHPFSFFRGTPLQKFVNPFSEKCPNKKVAVWLLNNDKTLFDTELGDLFCKYFKLSIQKIPTNIKQTTYTKEFPLKVDAYKYIGKSTFGKITARAMTRTPMITLAVNTSFELTKAIKDIKEGENFFIGIGKSLAKTSATATLTAFSGAIGSVYGPVGGLIGSAFGNIVGNKVSALVNQDGH